MMESVGLRRNNMTKQRRVTRRSTRRSTRPTRSINNSIPTVKLKKVNNYWRLLTSAELGKEQSNGIPNMDFECSSTGRYLEPTSEKSSAVIRIVSIGDFRAVCAFKILQQVMKSTILLQYEQYYQFHLSYLKDFMLEICRSKPATQHLLFWIFVDFDDLLTQSFHYKVEESILAPNDILPDSKQRACDLEELLLAIHTFPLTEMIYVTPGPIDWEEHYKYIYRVAHPDASAPFGYSDNVLENMKRVKRRWEMFITRMEEDIFDLNCLEGIHVLSPKTIIQKQFRSEYGRWVQSDSDTSFPDSSYFGQDYIHPSENAIKELVGTFLLRWKYDLMKCNVDLNNFFKEEKLPCDWIRDYRPNRPSSVSSN